MTLETASQPDRLSDEELKIERAKLEVWCHPQEFYDKVDALAAKVTPEDLFNSPRLGFLLDAMYIAEFAVKLGGVKSVRLATGYEHFPDGFVTTRDNKTLQVEVTEADHEGRRRGEEYKFGGSAKPRPSDDSEGMNVISKEVERVIQKKAGKHYKPKPTLVIYLNLDKEEINENDVASMLDEARNRHRASFQNIYLLWREKVF